MTDLVQLSLDDLTPARKRRGEKKSVLELIAADPIHARDKQNVLEAVKAAAREHGDKFSANEVRPFIAPWVFNRCVGPTYRLLRDRRVLVEVGATRSDDGEGRNSGRLIPVYEFHADRLAS